MKAINLDQGTVEWHQFRATHLTASQAPEMMGEGYTSRAAFLRNWGKEKNISSYQEMLFARGHELEAAALPGACEIVGDDLAPMTGVIDKGKLPDGLTEAEIKALDGRLSASFDGIDWEHTVLWEHKTWNSKIQDSLDAGVIPLQHQIQMQQQLLVSGAEKGLFMASDEKHCCYMWLYPDEEMQLRICQGWAAFLQELETAPDVIDLSQNADFLVLEGQYAAALKKLESAQRTVDHLKGLLVGYAESGDVQGLTISVQKITRKGSISYSKAFKSLMPEADLEPFRGDEVESYKVKEIAL